MKKKLKIGDAVVIYDYYNVDPQGEGVVSSLTEHFVQVEKMKGFFDKKYRKWYPRDKVELVIATS